MNGNERVKAIVDRKPADRNAYWTGRPHGDAVPKLLAYFQCKDLEELYRALGDDVRWIPVWNQPLEPRGAFATCETEADVERAFTWPNPDEFDLAPFLDELKRAKGYYRFSGNLSMFWHGNGFNGFGGMQAYFEKMCTHPEVVHAVHRRANDYYLRLNRRFFRLAGATLEAYKVSHDLGTQLNLMMSPAMLDEFVFPYIKEEVDLAHEFGHKALLHCCGAIRPILPRIIEIGVDLLHPIQAEAAGMDAESLVPFKDQLTFVGGISMQKLLVQGTPKQIRAEVFRVAKLLGPLVISPSHEALLPDAPPENVDALARAARECAL